VFVQVNTRTIRIVQSGTHHKAANTAESIDSNLGGHDENVQGNDDDETGYCGCAPKDFVVFSRKMRTGCGCNNSNFKTEWLRHAMRP
jgi:hypothetical protein